MQPCAYIKYLSDLLANSPARLALLPCFLRWKIEAGKLTLAQVKKHCRIDSNLEHKQCCTQNVNSCCPLWSQWNYDFFICLNNIFLCIKTHTGLMSSSGKRLFICNSAAQALSTSYMVLSIFFFYHFFISILYIKGILSRCTKCKGDEILQAQSGLLSTAPAPETASRNSC